MLLRIDISNEVLAWILFVVSMVVILSAVVVYILSGTRIQLVEEKKVRLLTLLSVLPGLLLCILAFALTLYVDSVTTFLGFSVNLANFTFSANGGAGGGTWSTFMIISLLLSLSTAILLKQHFYRSLDLESFQIQDHKGGNEILRAEQLKVHYPIYGGILKRITGYVKAVNGVSFSIGKGETLGLVGESGCGKSTIAKAVLGLVETSGGKIYFNNKELTLPLPNHLRQQIQIVFQDPDASLNPRMKIVDIVGEPLRNLWA